MQLQKASLLHSRLAANLDANLREDTGDSPLLHYNNIYTGVEIESEHWSTIEHNHRLAAAGWGVRDDGSLRGDEACECVSSPARGKTLVGMLKAYEGLSSLHGVWPFSYRCSTHFHINLLDMDTKVLANLVPLSLLADNFLYAIGDPERRGNFNCRPFSLLLGEIEQLAHMAACLEVQPKKARVREDLRYVGTNWAAMGKFGTLEFRHFPGENRTDVLVAWINTIHTIIAAAEHLPVEEHLDEFSASADSFGLGVFYDRWWDTLKYPDYEEHWKEAIQGVRAFYRAKRDYSNGKSFDSLLRRGFAVGGDDLCVV